MNVQHTELTEADEAEAYSRLLIIGISASAISKKTERTKSIVEKCAERTLKAEATTRGAQAMIPLVAITVEVGETTWQQRPDDHGPGFEAHT